jgi:hypothetical protein
MAHRILNAVLAESPIGTRRPETRRFPIGDSARTGNQLSLQQPSIFLFSESIPQTVFTRKLQILFIFLH